MTYATVEQVQARMTRTLSEDEQAVCATLLSDAGVMIDSFAACAEDDVKALVSCRMVIRALGDGTQGVAPVGATQGSMSALGYSQSWTLSGGATGELYLSKLEKSMLGLGTIGNSIGSYSPVQELAGRDPQ